jgi:hypothetical protein
VRTDPRRPSARAFCRSVRLPPCRQATRALQPHCLARWARSRPALSPGDRVHEHRPRDPVRMPPPDVLPPQRRRATTPADPLRPQGQRDRRRVPPFAAPWLHRLPVIAANPATAESSLRQLALVVYASGLEPAEAVVEALVAPPGRAAFADPRGGGSMPFSARMVDQQVLVGRQLEAAYPRMPQRRVPAPAPPSNASCRGTRQDSSRSFETADTSHRFPRARRHREHERRFVSRRRLTDPRDRRGRSS